MDGVGEIALQFYTSVVETKNMSLIHRRRREWLP